MVRTVNISKGAAVSMITGGVGVATNSLAATIGKLMGGGCMVHTHNRRSQEIMCV